MHQEESNSACHEHDADQIHISLTIVKTPYTVSKNEFKFEHYKWNNRQIVYIQVGLLNVDGYYNSLLCFIDKAVNEGFITPSARHIVLSAPTAQELMSKLEVHTHHWFIYSMCESTKKKKSCVYLHHRASRVFVGPMILGQTRTHEPCCLC